MSETLVTDEIVKKAAEAFSFSTSKVNHVVWFKDMRAALTAVVDDLVRAEREACELIALRERDKWRSEAAEEIADAIRARG